MEIPLAISAGNAIEKRVHDIVGYFLENDGKPITDSTAIQNGKIDLADDIVFVDILVATEKEFDMSIGGEEWLGLKTVKDLANLVSTAIGHL